MRRCVLAVIASLFLLAGATTVSPAGAVEPYFVNEANLPFTPLEGASAQWGVWFDAGYRIEVPEAWNGKLVLWAHGYRGTGLELTVTNPSIRAHLIGQGYAWAASSYGANGYAAGQGAVDTHRLIGLFEGLVGDPTKVYLLGQSMGGHVTGVAIEEWPEAFDGALPMCGVMGDSDLFDYFQDSYLLAETLVGRTPAVPTPADYRAVTLPETKALLGPDFPLTLSASGEQFKEAIENLTGGERPIFDEAFHRPGGGDFIFNNGSATTGAGRTNVGTVYQLDDDLALTAEEQALNDSIVRIPPNLAARYPAGPLERQGSPRIDGTISMPVLSLHTLGDPFVPFSMEQIYARRVAAQGASDLLVSRAIRDVGHCGFTQAEQIAAFDDLVRWVEDGVKPAGDDILNRATVADRRFGCAFTTPDRAALPACAPLVGAARNAAGGLWLAYANGEIATSGGATTYGDARHLPLNAPIVAVAPTADAGGYWLLGGDGGVFSFGNASFRGSTGDMVLNQPVVSMASDLQGRGYWLVASDGGIFSFGTPFFGSTGDLRLNRPVVAMAATTSGNGYWLVAADGGVFSFGDAVFSGSTGDIVLNQPVVGMAADPDGVGYWMVAADGGIFAFDAPFHGSGVGSLAPGDRATAMVARPAGGYWITTARGAVLPFGFAAIAGVS